MKQPNEYEKRILLAVSGMSPQIVTETLFSLATRQDDPFIPTDIYLITTIDGKAQAQQQLLHPDTGKFYSLCKDYQLSGINFSEQHIFVIEDADGNPLNDIKTPQNNEDAADFITGIVQSFIADDTALHVSIAGGRKTMGYYLGYSLSLYGRTQDRLSHVLVTDKYENLKDFFYPTPYSQIIFDREHRSLDAKDAEVMMAEIPFVRLTNGEVPPFLQKNKTTFSNSVRWAQTLENQPLLKVDTKNQKVLVTDLDIPIELSDVNFAFYLWLIMRLKDDKPALERRRVQEKYNNGQPDKEYAEEFLSVYKKYLPEMKSSARTEESLKNGMDDMFLAGRLTDINAAFKNVLGWRASSPYLIQKDGEKMNHSYSIKLPEEQILLI